MRGWARIALAVWLVASAPGCRLHIGQVRENVVIDTARYDAIELGQHRRDDVLIALGPPDDVFFAPAALVFDYRWQRHRGTDMRFFVPSEVLAGLDPLFLLSVPRFFFDQSEEPDAFRPTLAERIAQGLTQLATFFVPFTNGQDLMIASGHQLRHDRLRVVFDRQTLVAQGKSLRFASGDYRDESITSRILLRAD